MNANKNSPRRFIPEKETILHIIQFPIIQFRWVLIVFFLGLIAAQGIYCISYFHTLFELINHGHFLELTTGQVIMAILELMDMVLIVLLIHMVLVGSYENSIGKLHHKESDDHEHFTSGSLKIKMASSLVMVSAINMLQPFLDSEHSSWNDILKKCLLHVIFLTSAFGLSYIEYLHEKCHALEKIPPQSILTTIDKL